MSDQKPVLFDWLVSLTKSWNAHADVPLWQQDRCRELGRSLNTLGGMALMREAYYHAKGQNRYAASVQYYWDGIGEWRS